MTSDLLDLLGLALATFVGAVAQRSTGMGFALLAAPFLSLALGPFEGVLVANVCGAASATLNIAQVRRDIDWSRAAMLVPMGLVGIVPGAVAVALLPEAPLMVAVSVVVLAGVLLTLGLRGRTLPNSRPLAAAGGLASGFMSVTASVGGPGVAIYARATGWAHAGFAATAQLQFLVLGLASVAAKAALPSLTAVQWAVLALALVAGVLVGNRLARRLEPRQAMRLVMVLALGGSLVALARGIALMV